MNARGAPVSRLNYMVISYFLEEQLGFIEACVEAATTLEAHAPRHA